MAENKPKQHAGPDLSDPEMRHEHQDVNVWAVGKVGIALILTTIASMILMFGLFRYFEVRENAAQIPPASVTTPPTNLPPEPNLMFNQNESGNLQDIRADEDKLVNGYGWVDQAHGIARIPVDRAIDLVVQRGFPPRPKAPAAGEAKK